MLILKKDFKTKKALVKLDNGKEIWINFMTLHKFGLMKSGIICQSQTQ